MVPKSLLTLFDLSDVPTLSVPVFRKLHVTVFKCRSPRIHARHIDPLDFPELKELHLQTLCPTNGDKPWKGFRRALRSYDAIYHAQLELVTVSDETLPAAHSDAEGFQLLAPFRYLYMFGGSRLLREELKRNFFRCGMCRRYKWLEPKDACTMQTQSGEPCSRCKPINGSASIA